LCWQHQNCYGKYREPQNCAVLGHGILRKLSLPYNSKKQTKLAHAAVLSRANPNAP
jgi:hypothetical protein